MQASQKNIRVCMKIKHILYYTILYYIYLLYIYILYTYDNYQLQLQLRVFNSPTRSKLFSSFKNIFYGFKICVGHKTQKSKYINNEAIINFRIYAPIFAIGCLSLCTFITISLGLIIISHTLKCHECHAPMCYSLLLIPLCI